MFRTTTRTPRASSRSTRLGRAQRALCLLSIASLGACASTPGETDSNVPASPARVRFTDYRQGNAFELVNEAHTDRVTLYSQVSSKPITKVANNQVMSALLEYLESAGFHRYAHAGAAPQTSSTYQWGGEIETPSGTVYMVVSDKTPIEERKMFLECYRNHVSLWSEVFQLQRVDAKPGEAFKRPELRR